MGITLILFFIFLIFPTTIPFLKYPDALVEITNSPSTKSFSLFLCLILRFSKFPSTKNFIFEVSDITGNFERGSLIKRTSDKFSDTSITLPKKPFSLNTGTFNFNPCSEPTSMNTLELKISEISRIILEEGGAFTFKSFFNSSFSTFK